MNTKSHDRSEDKTNFSIALPLTLIVDITRIAENEDRSRNAQIERFLKQRVNEWRVENKSVLPKLEMQKRVTRMKKEIAVKKAETEKKHLTSMQRAKRKRQSGLPSHKKPATSRISGPVDGGWVGRCP